MVYVQVCKTAIQPGQNCPTESSVVIEVSESLLSSGGVPELEGQTVAAVFSSGLLLVIFCFMVARSAGAVLSVIRGYR